MERFKTTLERLLQVGGKISLELFGNVGVHYTKSSPSDVVTEADLQINDEAIRIINQDFPSHGIISEERDSSAGDGYDWIIDPIDGTLNFSRHTPLFGTMIALAFRREVILSGIILPALNETTIAWKGGGAWKNGQRVACSQQATLADSYGCGNARLAKERTPYLRRILDFAETAPLWVSSFGSAAVASAYMADGRRDWYYSMGGGVWDYAAPSLMLKEAGCIVTALDGKPWNLDSKQFLATNANLHPQMLKLIRDPE